jgi:hypothetical protein
MKPTPRPPAKKSAPKPARPPPAPKPYKKVEDRKKEQWGVK